MKKYTEIFNPPKRFSISGTGFKKHSYFKNNKNTIDITKINIILYSKETVCSYYKHGRMNVFFDKSTWDIEKDGHIMDDMVFLNELKKHFNINVDDEFATDIVYRFELRKTFISFDLDLHFVNSFLKVNGE